jgi:hypothetical protein
MTGTGAARAAERPGTGVSGFVKAHVAGSLQRMVPADDKRPKENIDPLHGQLVHARPFG